MGDDTPTGLRKVSTYVWRYTDAETNLATQQGGSLALAPTQIRDDCSPAQSSSASTILGKYEKREARPAPE